MVAFPICLLFIFAKAEAISSSRLKCNAQNVAGRLPPNRLAAADEAFWHEQLQRLGLARDGGDTELKQFVSELHNKQRMLEAIFGTAPKLNEPHLHAAPSVPPVDAFECLNNRRNAIVRRDPALSQAMNGLFAAEMSAKRKLQTMPGANDFSVLKTMRERLAFALLFLAKRHRIQLTAANSRQKPFVLTRQRLKPFLEELVKLTDQSQKCCAHNQCENCANDRTADGREGGAGGEHYARRKRLLQFTLRCIEIDWDGLGNNNALSNRSKNANRRRKRKRPNMIEPVTIGICVLFFLIMLLVGFLLCSDAIASTRSHRTFIGQNAAITELSQMNKKCLDAFKAIPPIVVAKSEFDDDESLDCAICLGSIEPGTEVRPLPVCKHKFHNECIELWIQGEHNACPICRQEMFNVNVLATTTPTLEHRQHQNIANSANRSPQNDTIAIDVNEGEEVNAERIEPEEQQRIAAATDGDDNAGTDNGQV